MLVQSFSEEELSKLKAWMIKRLENISDADPEVLADYVLALLKNDFPESQLRTSATESLIDFLRDNTESFVDELWTVIQLKSFHSLETFTSTLSPSDSQTIKSTVGNSPGKPLVQTHKRSHSYVDEHATWGPSTNSIGDRDGKHARRGDRGVKEHSNSRHRMNRLDAPTRNTYSGPPSQSVLYHDPSNAFMAIQAMGIPMPLVPSISYAPAAADIPMYGNRPLHRSNSVRCKDYDTKGICHKGMRCPFLHDASPTAAFVNSGYDPLSANTSSRNGSSRRTRAPFSQTTPNLDHSKTTVVVEKIPAPHFKDEEIRDFFSAFGPVQRITLKPSKHLAIVQFADYASAKAAYQSPKAIFDNRFVKVYWFNPDIAQQQSKVSKDPTETRTAFSTQESALSQEELKRRSEAAQERFKERNALRAATDAKLVDLAKQQEALSQAYEIEKQKLDDILRSRGKGQTPNNSGEDNVHAATEALRGQLRKLEDEAKRLGINPEPWKGRNSVHEPFRRRESTAYGGVHGAVHGQRSYQRSYGGHESARVLNSRAFNLDNRPKRVRVHGIPFDDHAMEILRNYLATDQDFTDISLGRTDGGEPARFAIADFETREAAERLFYGPRVIDDLGRVEMSWVANATVTSSGNEAVQEEHRNNSETNEAVADVGGTKEVDYDIAEDDNRWS